MLVCFPVFEGDSDKLLNLMIWIRQLGGCRSHDAVIVADPDTKASRIFEIKGEANHSFKSVDIITTEETVSGWIPGANSLFLKAAEYGEKANRPWLFHEPDAIPIKECWLDLIDSGYRSCGKPYMGALVNCETPGLPSIHLPGVSVYPPMAHRSMRPAIEANPTKAFDLSTADATVPHTFKSPLFQALWGEKGNPPRFSKKPKPDIGIFGLDYIKPEAALFHRNKDGSLMTLLREKKGIGRKNFIQLGRYGDIILLLPALKYIADSTGLKPRLICSKDYASVLDGVSYVEPVPLPIPWYMGMPIAIKHAKHLYGGATVLQCHGHNWGIDMAKWPNFMFSMIDRTGVPLSMFNYLPLVFDRRSKERENSLIPKPNGKKTILINTTGTSSPFRHAKQLHNCLSHFRPRLNIIDIGNMRCHRIYDLLGLMDHAIGSIHIDTATLHLAHGCKKPYIALTVDGWTSSVPRGNCVLNVKYSAFMSSLSKIVQTVESWI